MKKNSEGRGRVEANGHKQEGLEEMRQGMGVGGERGEGTHWVSELLVNLLHDRERLHHLRLESLITHTHGW